jgi:hypothetical protein
VFSQPDFIYSKEGKPMLYRRDLIFNCLRSMNTDRNNESALSICECQIDKLNGYFTNKQYRSVTKMNVIDVAGLIKLDSNMDKQFQKCYTGSNQTILLSAQGFKDEMIAKCRESLLYKNTIVIDTSKVENFCSCQLDLIKSKKILDDEMKAINDPNSILFYQVMATCGDPFSTGENDKGWTATSEKDISGPETDTILVLGLNGMHYLKLKVGSVVYFWLLDTGASDMFITKDLEQVLLNEKVLTPGNYKGVGLYELANGVVDTCRKYLLPSLLMGHYTINDITVAVSDKGRRVIAGKTLLNKFSYWMINNKENKLILHK